MNSAPEHKILEGNDLPRLLSKLNACACEGWELVTASCISPFGVGGIPQHFLFLRKAPAPIPQQQNTTQEKT